LENSLELYCDDEIPHAVLPAHTVQSNCGIRPRCTLDLDNIRNSRYWDEDSSDLTLIFNHQNLY